MEESAMDYYSYVLIQWCTRVRRGMIQKMYDYSERDFVFLLIFTKLI